MSRLYTRERAFFSYSAGLTTRPLSEAGPSSHSRRATSSCLTPHRRTLASTSSARARGRSRSHYETLNIPQNASRAEVKGAYFRLSKLYHPDLRTHRQKEEGSSTAEDEKESTEKFHAVNEAYKVLGDDRARRAYDRSLVAPSHHSDHGHFNLHHSHYPSYHYQQTGRKRGATYAWESRHSSGPQSRSNIGSGRHYDPATGTTAGTTTNSFTGPQAFTYSWRMERTAGASARDADQRRAHDAITRESAMGRFLSFMGILFFISVVGGIGKGGG